jgi:predicted phage-related endonuclease
VSANLEVRVVDMGASNSWAEFAALFRSTRGAFLDHERAKADSLSGLIDLSGNLIVQLGVATEPLNRNWYERNTGQTVECVQHRLMHPVLRWMGATLDGIIAGSGMVFEAKFMLPWSFSEGAAAEKHMPQVQHNMWVTNAREAALSIITGGGKWVEIKIAADPLYQHLLLTAEKKFWRCVESGESPILFQLPNVVRDTCENLT